MTMPDEDLTPSDHLTPEERDPEAPAADAVEQAISANPAEAAPEIHRGLEVSEYDAVEQAHIVDMDDEYREG
ncbi:hypothetical protein GCM10009682_07620 [Luedemannella flava]|uniref:Uncharacterized protein n=1 Tax=Luedemannella flava TaxID=349316 RepID=A0ABN2LH51_9ACTN